MGMQYWTTQTKYPPNWGKISRVLCRRTGGQCSRCHLAMSWKKLTVHHIGAPRPTGDGWTAGNPRDKHDVRLENLMVLCDTCHTELEPYRASIQQRQNRKANKLQAHRALNLGVGLVLYQGAMIQCSHVEKRLTI